MIKKYFSKVNGNIIEAYQWDGNLQHASEFFGEHKINPHKLLMDSDSTLFGFNFNIGDCGEFYGLKFIFFCLIGEYLILDRPGSSSAYRHIRKVDEKTFEDTFCLAIT